MKKKYSIALLSIIFVLSFLITGHSALVENGVYLLIKDVEALTGGEQPGNWNERQEMGLKTIVEIVEKMMHSPTGMPIWYSVEEKVDVSCCVRSNFYTACNNADEDSRCP